MQATYLILCLGIVLFHRAEVLGGPSRSGRTWPVHEHSHAECSHVDADGPEDGEEELVERPGAHGSFHGGHSCSCMLMVGPTVVYRSEDNSGWYSCSGWGLHRCQLYCSAMDENTRYRSRQEACDVFGYEIYTPWYRRNQVCGYHGPYDDSPLQADLCCRRGRPSQGCSEEDRF